MQVLYTELRLLLLLLLLLLRLRRRRQRLRLLRLRLRRRLLLSFYNKICIRVQGRSGGFHSSSTWISPLSGTKCRGDEPATRTLPEYRV